MEETRESGRLLLVKYFVHGLVFSVLLLLLTLLWALGFFVLVVLGRFIGIFLGIAIWLVVIGYTNTVVTRWLWFPVASTKLGYLFHGLILLIVLLPIHLAISLALGRILQPSIITTVVTIPITSLINGYVGRGVAGLWRGPTPPSPVTMVRPSPGPGVCTRCGKAVGISQAMCPICGAPVG